QDAGAAPRSGCNVATIASAVLVISTARVAGWTLSVLSFTKQNSASLGINDVFAWEIWHQMSRHAYRSYARSAATVRNAERLVQIQVANVRTVIAGATKTDLRVQVCAVHVNLAAMRVNDRANFANCRLEHAVR